MKEREGVAFTLHPPPCTLRSPGPAYPRRAGQSRASPPNSTVEHKNLGSRVETEEVAWKSAAKYQSIQLALVSTLEAPHPTIKHEPAPSTSGEDLAGRPRGRSLSWDHGGRIHGQDAAPKYRCLRCKTSQALFMRWASSEGFLPLRSRPALRG